MARKKYDDLEEMRKDVDKLGTALGLRPSGKSKREPVPKKPVKAPANASTNAPAKGLDSARR